MEQPGALIRESDRMHSLYCINIQQQQQQQKTSASLQYIQEQMKKSRPEMLHCTKLKPFLKTSDVTFGMNTFVPGNILVQNN